MFNVHHVRSFIIKPIPAAVILVLTDSRDFLSGTRLLKEVSTASVLRICSWKPVDMRVGPGHKWKQQPINCNGILLTLFFWFPSCRPGFSGSRLVHLTKRSLPFGLLYWLSSLHYIIVTYLLYIFDYHCSLNVLMPPRH